MTPQDLTWLFEKLAKYGIGGIVAGGVVFLLCRNFLSAYLNKKGENLATKEDIAQLTRLVKDVEHGYNVLIKQMEAKQQLRMAAMDRRLQAHQESITLWRRMLRTGENIGQQNEIVAECQNWWDANCLYLEPEVREAFSLAYTSYSSRNSMLRSRFPAEDIIAVWDRFSAFPDILFAAVKLPALTEAEQESIMQPLP